jgi:hypothetical protein
MLLSSRVLRELFYSHERQGWGVGLLCHGVFFKMVGSQLDKMAGRLAGFLLGFPVGDAQRTVCFQSPSEAAF